MPQDAAVKETSKACIQYLKDKCSNPPPVLRPRCVGIGIAALASLSKPGTASQSVPRRRPASDASREGQRSSIFSSRAARRTSISSTKARAPPSRPGVARFDFARAAHHRHDRGAKHLPCVADVSLPATWPVRTVAHNCCRTSAPLRTISASSNRCTEAINRDPR